jgi:WD40 repeat protein
MQDNLRKCLFSKGLVGRASQDLGDLNSHVNSDNPLSELADSNLYPYHDLTATAYDSGYQKEIVQFWSAKTGNLLGEIRTHYRIRDIAFSSNGYLIAVSGDDGLVRIWGVKKDG